MQGIDFKQVVLTNPDRVQFYEPKQGVIQIQNCRLRYDIIVTINEHTFLKVLLFLNNQKYKCVN